MGGTTTFERIAPPAAATDPLEERIVAAMLECIERWGIAKTTADDIANAAGISRATLYRAFPGGKDVAFDALVRHEAARFFHAVTSRLDEAQRLEDLLTVGIVEAARFLAGHGALSYVMAHEPERLLPEVTFDRLARSLDVTAAFAAAHLRRFVDDDEQALHTADWVVRILLSYATNPSPRLTLTDDADVRRFVTTYLVPAIAASAGPFPDAPKER